MVVSQTNRQDMTLPETYTRPRTGDQCFLKTTNNLYTYKLLVVSKRN